MTDLIIHIGLSKCGSTTIQKFFSSEPTYLGRGAKTREANNFSIELLRASHANRIGGLRRAKLKTWCARASKYAKKERRAGSAIIVSSEVLGKPKSGSYDSLYEFLNSVQADYRAGKLKVLLILRNQISKIASEYSQRSARRFNASQEDFEKFAYSRMKKSDLQYYSLVKGIYKIIGKANTKILLLESMSTDAFWEEIIEFCDLPADTPRRSDATKRNKKSMGRNTWALPNPCDAVYGREFANTLLTWTWAPTHLPRMRAKAQHVLARLYIILRSLVLRLEKKRQNKISLTEQMARDINKKYRAENSELSSILKADLGNLGYPS